MPINPRKVFCGNVPAWYGREDVRRAVVEAGFANPAYINLSWGVRDTQYAVLTFTSDYQAATMLAAGRQRNAMHWENGWHVLIRRRWGDVQCATSL